MVHSTETPSPRTHRREANTRRILDAAGRLIAAEGFEALTMHRLAADLGYRVGALYRYFASKDALLVALLGEVLEALQADFARTATAMARRVRGEAAGAAALAQVLAALATYASMAERRPEQFRLLATAIGDPAELTATTNARAVVPRLGEAVAQLACFLAEAEAHGALQPGDAERRTVVVWAAVHGQLLMRKFGRLGMDAFEPRGLVGEVVVGLLVGWGASADALRSAWPAAERTARSAQRRAA